jgi:hypothetical protein
MQDVTIVIMAIVGSLAGVILGFMLELFREKRNKAKLEFNEYYLEPFEESARGSIRVKHVGGKLPATNTISLLTIETRGKLSEIAVRKVDGKCELEDLCKKCSGKVYLASGEAGVRDEALPWSLPIEAGVGMQNLRYAHLIHIPVGGSSLLRLFDIYRVKVYGPHARGKPREVKGEFWLIKVHSEYGVHHHPKICLKLPIKGDYVDIHFIIRLAGENLRESMQTMVTVKLRNGECVTEWDEGKPLSLNEHFRDKDIKPLELKPKGFHP